MLDSRIRIPSQSSFCPQNTYPYNTSSVPKDPSGQFQFRINASTGVAVPLIHGDQHLGGFHLLYFQMGLNGKNVSFKTCIQGDIPCYFGLI